MRIKSFETNPALLINQKFDAGKPICVIRGRRSDIVLDLLRELIGNYTAQSNLDGYNNGHFVLYGNVEIDEKNYDVCRIHITEVDGINRLAVNFIPGSTEFSLLDTKEYEQKCHARNFEERNVYAPSSAPRTNENFLSANDHNVHSFNEFIKDTKLYTQKGDNRPIFIYNFFDHIDEAEVITPFIDELTLLGRQVFISVSTNYPEEKMRHSLIQIINSDCVRPEDWEWLDVGEVYDSDYTVISCPVCGHKTLDNYWICSHCDWEHDGSPEDHYSACNGATLHEYRERYKKELQSLEASGYTHVKF